MNTNIISQAKDNIDILHGHLLGDGSVYRVNKNRSNCSYSHACKHKEYLEWIVSNTPIFNNPNIRGVSSYDKRTNKTYHRYHFRTASSIIYTNLRDLWYPQGKKILPNDVIINSRSLLRFYLDDGSYHPSGNYLATNDFNLSDLELLLDKIILYTNLNWTIHKTGKEDAYKLFLSKKQRKDFLHIIGNCPVSCYEYKWRE